MDNTFLCLLLHPNARPRENPSTGQVISHSDLRLQALVQKHAANKDTIVIPAPCFSELLVSVPDLARAIKVIQDSSALEIRSFDAKAAFELALINRKAMESGDKKSGSTAGWQQIKFERQIAVTAQVNGAEIFYTDDDVQKRFALEIGMKVTSSWEIELPAAYAQADLV